MSVGQDIRRSTNKYSGNYRGLVVSTTDPLNQGRIKVRIYPIMDKTEVPDAALPWAVPAFPLFDGSGPGNNGSFTVPKVGTMVWCFFEAEDFMQPVYFAEARDGVNGIFVTPDIKQWLTDSGFTIMIDETNKTIRVVHPSGSEINIDNTDGTVLVQSVGSQVHVDSAGKIDITAGSDINIEATGNVVIKGSQVSINP